MLVSWAVPKGPTLDPDGPAHGGARRGPPARLLRLRGRHPARASTAAATSSSGTGAPGRSADGDDPVEARRRRRPALRPARREAGRSLRRSSAAAAATARSSGCCCTSTTTHAVAGLGPRGPPALGEDRPHQRRGRRPAPAATWTDARASRWAPPDRATSWPPSTRWARAATGSSAAARCKLTNLDKVLFPAAPAASRPVTKRDLVRYHAVHRAGRCSPTSPTGRSTCTASPTASTSRGSGTRPRRATRPTGSPAGDNEDADPGETELYLGARLARRRWPGLANYGAHRAAPVDLDRPRRPHEPTWAMIDIDPGTDTTFDDVLVLARLHRTALEHLGVGPRPRSPGKRGIQIWVPVAERLHVRRHPGLGRAAVAGRRRDGARPGQLGRGRRPSAAGMARLDYTQNAINKTLVAPFSARPAPGRAGVGADHLGRARRPRPRAPTAGRSAPSSIASPSIGDPLRPLVGLDQELPAALMLK